MKKRVLITGASGFIGRNLFKHFDSLNGYEAYGTYLKNKPTTVSPRIFQADLRNYDHALSVTNSADIVINCAAMTAGVGVFSAQEKMAEFIADNILINQNLIEASDHNRVKHFIFLSCTVMYPSSLVPLPEAEFNLNKVHPKYLPGAQIKIFAENLCRVHAEFGNTKYVAVRHTNVYGPHDKFDLAQGHVLAATITKVMEAKNQITVWGNGKESRDFLHISDLIKFVEKAIERQENNFEIFNVGSGRTCSVNDLVENIISHSGKTLNVVHDINKPTIETHMNIDVRKAECLLGWKPEIELSEGLVMTLDWYLNQPR